MTFLDDWMRQGGGRHPSQLDRLSIRNDMWDLRYFEQMLAEMRTFEAERRALCEVAETGNGLWADIFNSFMKVGPELVEPGSLQAKYLINRAVMEQLMTLKEFDRLKQWTEGDAVASASACITMRPDLEQLHDRTRTAQKRAEELQRLQEELAQAQAELRDLDALVAEWTASHDPTDPENQEEAANYQQAQQLIEADVTRLQEEMEAEAGGLESDMVNEGAMIHALLRSAVTKAADAAEELSISCRMWGLDPGRLTRMPAAERLALARRTNTEHFRRMADLFGPLERALATEQQRKANRVPEEIYDLERGSDLNRVLPSEYAKLIDGRKAEFYAGYSERTLLQYAMRGTDKVARGGMVVCVDNSGSMKGDNERWAKAIALTLLNLCRQQKRSFWGIHFGSASEIMEFDFSRTVEWDFEKVLDFAEYFFNGGTNFVRPLSLALDHVRTEFDVDGATQSDIILITDGQCGVPAKWKTSFLEEMDRIGSALWGFNIGGGAHDQPMYDLCKGKVATVQDVLDSTKDVAKIFAGL